MISDRGLFFFDFDKTASNPIQRLNEQILFKDRKFTLLCEVTEGIFVIGTIERPHFLKINRETR